jgi:hypothetical protein
MNMPDRLGADYWRERAKGRATKPAPCETRKQRPALLGITENYEQLAEQAERIRNTQAALVGLHQAR